MAFSSVLWFSKAEPATALPFLYLLSGSGFGGSGFKVQGSEVRRKHMRIERFKNIEEWRLVRELTRKVSEVSLIHRFRRLHGLL